MLKRFLKLFQRRKKPIAVSITSHGLSNFRKYVLGQITLAEFKKARIDQEIKEL